MMAEDCVTPFFEIVTRRFPSMRIPITDLIFKFIKTFIKIKLTEKKRKGSSRSKVKVGSQWLSDLWKISKMLFFFLILRVWVRMSKRGSV